MEAERTFKLNTGATIPAVGLGTWTIFGDHGSTTEVEEAVKAAIELGYRHIDTAFVYDNISAVGRAVNAKIQDGTVKREDLFITSKLWCTYLRKESVMPQLKKELEQMGLEYLDMYLIHWLLAYKTGDVLFPKDAAGKMILADDDYRPLETWQGLEECQDAGLTKAIGLSNCNSKQIQEILDGARIKPANIQVEIHPLFSNSKLIQFCREKIPGVVITAYAPLCAPGRPWRKPTDPILFDDPRLVEIAKKKNKTQAQVVLRYMNQKGYVIIPKSIKKERLKENFDIFDFKLSPEEMKIMDGFDKNFRIYWEDIGRHSPHYPFNEEF
ncbi:aldose reductase [Lingula anatina]|uniref:Aldose reductase n=1 Tax=Lingula anatina TaxID=7574 RepID=A0A1S3HDK6_LINAN|nr:aldose reductase [Lingula anatina]|eukprot:XP_013383596.1 aldose reductase [Lingula anatina]